MLLSVEPTDSAALASSLFKESNLYLLSPFSHCLIAFLVSLTLVLCIAFAHGFVQLNSLMCVMQCLCLLYAEVKKT